MSGRDDGKRKKPRKQMNLLRGFQWPTPKSEDEERKYSEIIRSMVCDDGKTLLQAEEELVKSHGFAREEAKKVAIYVAPKVRMLSSSLGSVVNKHGPPARNVPVPSFELKRKLEMESPAATNNRETKALKPTREEDTLEDKLSRSLSSGRTVATESTPSSFSSSSSFAPRGNGEQYRGFRGGNGGGTSSYRRGGGRGYGFESSYAPSQYASFRGGRGAHYEDYRSRGRGRAGYHHPPPPAMHDRLADTASLDGSRPVPHKNQTWVRPGLASSSTASDPNATAALNESLPSTP